MNKKVISLIGIVVFVMLVLTTAVIAANNEILQINNTSDETYIRTEYVYNEQDNTEIVRIISNNKLKDTKSTWDLSKDKKEYTKVFTENKKYSTPVQDIYGKVFNVEIEFNSIQPLKLKVEYNVNHNENFAEVSIISNTELKDTKSSWNLSNNKRKYTKKFYENIKYSTPVEDINGNIKNVDINITEIDKTGPIIDLDYKYNSDNTVTVFIKSNEELANTKSTWKLSDDKKIYEKKFENDLDYSTPVQDLFGNTTQVYIKLKKKMTKHMFSDGGKLYVGYMLTKNNEVIVQVTANTQLKNTKPTWKLSDDKYSYIKKFTDDINYSTPFVNKNGVTINVPLKIDWFYKIIVENGTYGWSGAAIQGKNGGSTLNYLRFGNGPNVFFAIFCVHGFEDNWWADGNVLANIADDFYNKLLADKDVDIAKKWTIYIIREVNPDGLNLGYTKDGPGRTTVYSSLGRGIDINRSWQTGSEYTKYTDDRNYNGKAGFQAYEAAYLRNFLLSHKSTNGKTVLVDLHGWEDQLIGDSDIGKYYKQQYTSCSTKNYGSYGKQYLISWARQNLGAKSALVELPSARNWSEVKSMKLSEKYVNATLNMLKEI
ncbi:MAG: hypothetical protein J5881_03490 [Clostridia bacterium]|nr:hypothetical protein [Clostridia bacterium]